MNVLLVNPRSVFQRRALNAVTMPDIPLNMACIAAVLEGDGHVVRIVDLNVVKTKDELKLAIREFRWGLIGLTGTTSVILNVYKTARVLKRLFHAVPIVLGGWHASGVPVRTMQECKELDFVVKGEGEITVRELARAVETGSSRSGILGLVCRGADGSIIENGDRPLIRDLDALPFPSIHLLPLDAYREIGFDTVGGYFKKDKYIFAIATSRGCTGRCIFCADRTIHHGKCRFFSPDRVIAELKHAIETRNVEIFFFMDPHFTQSPVRARRICERIIEEGLNITWACSARVDTVTPALLRLMRRAGCTRVGYGIESGSPRVLKLMNKDVNIVRMKDAVRWTKEAGLIAVTYFLYGIPGETLDDARLTRQLIFEMQPHYVNQTIAIPYPGSELRELALRNGLIADDRWEFYNYPFGNVLDYPGIEATFKFQAKVMFDYYLNPGYLLRTILGIRSMHQLVFYAKVIRFLALVFIIFNGERKADVKRTLSMLTTREEAGHG